MTSGDDLVTRNAAYAESFTPAGLDARPSGRLAVVACMDARLDLLAALGLRPGEAHILRNAGAVVTDDVLRSLVVSQRLLGTTSIAVVAHTDCGMTSFRDEDLASEIAAETGRRPPFAFGAFRDIPEEVRRSVATLVSCPFLPRRDDITGYVFDVATGRLRIVAGTDEESPVSGR